MNNNDQFALKLYNTYPQYTPDGYKEGIYKGDNYGLVFYIISQLLKNDLKNSNKKNLVLSSISSLVDESYSFEDSELDNMIKMEILSEFAHHLHQDDYTNFVQLLKNKRAADDAKTIMDLLLLEQEKKSFFAKLLSNIKSHF